MANSSVPDLGIPGVLFAGIGSILVVAILASSGMIPESAWAVMTFAILAAIAIPIAAAVTRRLRETLFLAAYFASVFTPALAYAFTHPDADPQAPLAILVEATLLGSAVFALVARLRARRTSTD